MKKIIVWILTLCCLLNICGCVRTSEKMVFEQPYTKVCEIHIIEMDAHSFEDGSYYNWLLECSIKKLSIDLAEELYLDVEALPTRFLLGMEMLRPSGKCILIQYEDKSFHIISLSISLFYQYDIKSDDYLEKRDEVIKENNIHFEKSNFDELIGKYLNI